MNIIALIDFNSLLSLTTQELIYRIRHFSLINSPVLLKSDLPLKADHRLVQLWRTEPVR